MKTALLLIAALVAGSTTAALACSPPPSWQDEGFRLFGAPWEGPTTVPSREYLVLSTFAFDLPAFPTVAEALTVEVTDAAGQVVPGRLAPSPLAGNLIWVPEVPLEGEGPWSVTSSVTTSWGEPRVLTTPFRVAPVGAPRANRLAIEATKADHTIFGPCIEENFDSCGAFCEEAEVIREEVRFGFTVAFDDFEPGGLPLAQRTGVGATEAEALAVLGRSVFFGGTAAVEVPGMAYATWPQNEACVAVEVRTLANEVLAQAVRCLPLIPDEALGRDVQARLDREADPPPVADAEGEGGCHAGGGGTQGPWLLALGLLAIRRRR